MSKPNKHINLLKLFLAGFTVVAIATLTADSIDQHIPLIHIYGFFTVQSNLFALAIFSISAIWDLKKRNLKKLDMWRGAATLYMLITGVVYFVLLRDVHASFVREWVNTVLHGIMPIALLLDWILQPPAKKIPFRRSLVWFIYPVLYLTYSMLRGAITGIYPYAFLDPTVQGVFGVVVTCIMITGGFVVGAVGLIQVKKK